MATLDVSDNKLIEDMTEYCNNFIAQRFTEDLPAEFKVMITDIILESFSAGAEWAEQNMQMAGEIIAAKVPRIEVVTH